MNPTETSSIATYYHNAKDDEDEEQKETNMIVAADVTLKDIDSKTKD